MIFKTVYIGRTRFSPHHPFRVDLNTDPDPKPWCIQYHGNGHHYQHLESALAYATGRGFITASDADRIKQEILSKMK